MNKLYISAIAVMLSFTYTNAQRMQTYGVQVTSGTYQELTGATTIPVEDTGEDFNNIVIDGTGTGNYDEFTGQGFPIGFDFEYNGKKVNQFAPSTNGYVILGKDDVYWSGNVNPFGVFDNSKDNNLVGFIPIADVRDIPETRLSYKVEGAAPNRVLVVQYKDLGVMERNNYTQALTDTVQLQFRFYEESGNVSIICRDFKPWSGANMKNMSLKIGILGDVGDRILLTDFASGETSTINYFIPWSQESYPTDGTTYTFVAPKPCVTPATQPTQISLSSTSKAVRGTFSPTSDADHYLVLVTKEEELDEMPADGTKYAENDKLGQATVVAYTPDPSFVSKEQFESSSDYNVFVISSNAQCSNGPVYKLKDPLKGKIRTMGEAPKSITVNNVDANKASLSVEALEGSQVLVAVTDSLAKMKSGLITSYDGKFGSPQGTYKVGDEFEGGGRVVYIGPSGSFNADGLVSGKMHVFCAWSTDGNGSYSSDTTRVQTITSAYMPWDAGIEKMALNKEPIGWKYKGAFKKLRADYIQGCPDYANAETTDIWLETPTVYLSEKPNRVFAAITLEEEGNSDKFKFEEGEYLKVQVATDANEYEDIAVFNKDNDPGFTGASAFSDFAWTFSKYAGEKVRFRFLIHSTKKVLFSIKSLSAVQKPECDYPVDVKSTDIKENKAKISWKPQGDESTWEVSYKLSTDKEWSEPIMINESSYTLENLESYKKYDVRVRAVCSQTSQSEWSEVCTFKSDLYIPFLIKFEEEETEPNGWGCKTGALADPTVLEDGSDFSFNYYYGKGYLDFDNFDETCDSWYVTSQLDLVSGKEYELSMEIHTNYWSNYSTPSTDNKLMFVVAKDGENFYSKDVLHTVEYDEYKEENKDYSFTVPVKDCAGKVKFGIYVKSTTGSPLSFNVLSIGLKEKDASGISNATDGKAAAGSKPVAIYNAAGQRTDRLQKGINIVHNADGTTRKVLVK